MADPTKEAQEPQKGELSADKLNAVTGGTAPAPQVALHVRKAGGEHVEFFQTIPKPPNG
jgi:hypothetical protein